MQQSSEDGCSDEVVVSTLIIGNNSYGLSMVRIGLTLVYLVASVSWRRKQNVMLLKLYKSEGRCFLNKGEDVFKRLKINPMSC